MDASELAPQAGRIDGTLRLRTFPVAHRFGDAKGALAAAALGGGVSGEKNVDWTQSHGQVRLTHRIEGLLPERRAWSEDDVEVNMCAKEMKVLLNGEPFKALSGEFLQLIWAFKSWWAVEDGVLIINLYKRELSSWKHPFHGAASQGLFRRNPFPWTKPMATMGGGATFQHGNPNIQDVPKEEELELKPPGRPPLEAGELLPDGSGVEPELPGGVFAPRFPGYICSAEDLCIGITAELSESKIIVEVHFELERYEQLKARFPLEALFAADITSNTVCIFFQGDKANPIVWGELDGTVDPGQTTWRMSSNDNMRQEQVVTDKYSPCLQVKMTKLPNTFGRKVFQTSWQHRLMVKEIGEFGPERFSGVSDGKTYLRAGYNLDDPDFWGNVDSYVNLTMKRSGYDSAPKRLQMAA